jgi:hypothetical protein
VAKRAGLILIIIILIIVIIIFIIIISKSRVAFLSNSRLA